MKKILLLLTALFSIISSAQFYEGFEGEVFPPAGWMVSDNGTGISQSWQVTESSTAFEGFKSAWIDRENNGQGNTSEDWLVTPAVMVSTGALLSFYNRSGFLGNQGTIYEIRISTTSQTDPSSFTSVEQWTEDELSATYNVYEQKIVSLDAYAGQSIYIAFVKSFTQPTASLSGDRWYVDAVSVGQPVDTFNMISGMISYSPTNDCSDTFPIGNNLQLSVGNATGIYAINSDGYSFTTPFINTDIDVSISTQNGLFEVNPESYTFNFSDTGNNVTANFCISPIGVHPDLYVHGSVYAPSFLPGNQSGYRINYHNYGNQLEDAVITLQYDESRLDFVGSNFPVAAQSDGVISFNINDIVPGYFYDAITVTFMVNTPTDSPPVNAGDLLEFTTNISSALPDENTDNNTDVTIVEVAGPFDPNDKTVFEGETISPEDAENPLHYMIRFQNIGTAPANDVRITDQIASNFNMSTLRIIGGSHPFNTIINVNSVEFKFNDINLPPESEGIAESQGYVLYSIKPNTTEIGTVFSNTANIYFDFNLPITTNTATTTITELSIPDNGVAESIVVYPNPAKETISIMSSEIAIISVKISNTLGQTVITQSNGNYAEVDITNLKSGIYFVNVATDGGNFIKQLIKQ